MRRPLAPREMYPAGEPDIDTRFVRLSTGLTVRVAERGPANGQPALMLHGWGACIYMWRHAFQLLPVQSIRVIAVDLRGFGLSDKPSGRGAYSLDAYCADLDALYVALGVSRMALVGHSMGGALALHYALRRPDRVHRLGLINPADLVPLIYPTLLRATPRALSDLIGKRFIPRSLISLILRRVAYGNPTLVTEADIDQYWAPTQLPGFVHAASATLHEFDWHPVTEPQASSLAPPTAVILGRSDRLIRRARARAERLNGAQVHELAGGHSVHEERPVEAYEILGGFIR